MLGDATHDCAKRPPAVLIVEDDAALCEAIGFCVEQAGYEVVDCAQSVDAALATLGRRTVDAALLDINLQGELVYPVARALTERGVPFVFVTGQPTSEIPEQFRHRPVVPKPYYDAALCAALASMLPLARPH
jgi:DNA-binding response OmpR family regulator